MYVPVLCIIIISLVLFVWIKYFHKKPHIPVSLYHQDFTLKQLREYDGTLNKPIYIAVNGKIFDVSHRKDYYGPNGPYSIFAGHDATKGLAKFDLTQITDFPSDLSDLSSKEMESVKEWELQFSDNFNCVGRLIRDNEEPWDYSSLIYETLNLYNTKNLPTPNKNVQQVDIDDTKKRQPPKKPNKQLESMFEPLFKSHSIPTHIDRLDNNDISLKTSNTKPDFHSLHDMLNDEKSSLATSSPNSDASKDGIRKRVFTKLDAIPAGEDESKYDENAQKRYVVAVDNAKEYNEFIASDFQSLDSPRRCSNTTSSIRNLLSPNQLVSFDVLNDKKHS